MKRIVLFLVVCIAVSLPGRGVAVQGSAPAASGGSMTMRQERTFGIIKPDAVQENRIGAILKQLEKAGLKIVHLQLLTLSPAKAGEFYAVHKGRPFYDELVNFMSSGPVVAMVLEGPNAVKRYREVMGATDPQEAAKGTLRAKYGHSKGQNAVHGSDSSRNARQEISFFFG